MKTAMQKHIKKVIPKRVEEITKAISSAAKTLINPSSDLDLKSWLELESREYRNEQRRQQLKDWRENNFY